MNQYSCPPRLYKYLGYVGLQKTLQNRSIKLSRPNDFNDPLDMFLQEALGMDEIDFLNKLKSAFYDFISGDINYALLRESPDKNKIILMNIGLRNADPDARERMRNELINTPIEDLYNIERIRSTTQDALNALTDSFRHSGVFCSTLDFNNLLMWAHYADHHKGAVIEFTPSIEKDSPLLVSKAINYTTVRPLLYRNPVDLITHGLMMTEKASVENLVDSIIYTKSSHWAYEREYRLCVPRFIPDGKQHETLAFHGDELTSIYLGCRMTAEYKKQTIALAKTINPSVRAYEAIIRPREFELHFVEFIGA